MRTTVKAAPATTGKKAISRREIGA